DGAVVGAFDDGRLVLAGVVPVIAYIVELAGRIRKAQADMQPSFFEQRGADLYSNQILLLVGIGEHIDRDAFEGKMAFYFGFPHVQLLVHIVQVADGGLAAVFFSELETEVAQLEAMYVLAEIIAGVLVAYGCVPLYGIRHLATVQVVIAQAFVEAET